jgi:hypothetical protein
MGKNRREQLPHCRFVHDQSSRAASTPLYIPDRRQGSRECKIGSKMGQWKFILHTVSGSVSQKENEKGYSRHACTRSEEGFDLLVAKIAPSVKLSDCNEIICSY